MANFTHLLRRFAWLWLWLPVLSAAAQTTTSPAVTADDYIRPYTGTFHYGVNSGYYGTGWDDVSLATIAQQAGVHTLRPTLPESFVENFGYNIRQTTFDTYVNRLGMEELTCFIGGPAPWHADFTTYPGCTQPSKLFGHLYDPIWQADGTVNPSNLYAIYVYKLIQIYGDKVRFWEVVNEPDFTNGADASAWLTRAPTPAEQLNTQAPFYHYIRMLRITYEIVKKYQPQDYVTTGGLGTPEYVDALLRYTDEPTAGAVTSAYPKTGGAYFDVLSFHAYPNYALHYWDNTIGGFRYTRTSDYSAQRVLQYKNEMATALIKYGYDGTRHPAKLWILTESNVSRRTSDDRTGSDEMQRNFAIKNLVLLQKNGVTQYYQYVIGEGVDAPPAGTVVSGSDELNLMGLYENLYKATPTTVKMTQGGQAFATTSKLLYGYTYDAARSAALGLPAAVDGAAFSKGTNVIYVLWAKALVDNVEQAAATYSFPAALGMASMKRYEWDFSATGASTSQAAQGLALTTTPSFFTQDAAATSCSATGLIAREQWDNVSGSSVSTIPVTTTATSIGTLAQLETTLATYNYGARMRGILCAPATGSYTFWIAGDDESELWLSTDDDPTHKVRIASCAGWTSGARDYYRYASQQSAAVTLTAGTKYYLEVLHKQGWGPGYVSVAWKQPNGTLEAPMAATRLSPYTATATTTPPPTPPASACSGTGSLAREQWNNVSGSTVAAVPVTTTASSTAAITQFETSVSDFNYGARMRGYVCPPTTGNYTFSLCADDAAELYLSTDALPANKVRIANCSGWTSGIHDYTRYPEQQSASIRLTAGTRYYIEVLHKQSWGPGYASVAWRLPDGTTEAPMPGSRLVPFLMTTSTSAATGTAAAMRMAPATSASAGPATTILAAYPNPFTQQTTVQYSLAADGPVSLALYSVDGRLVRQLAAGTVAAGTSQSFTLDRQGLSEGLYLLRLVSGNEVRTQKLMLSK